MRRWPSYFITSKQESKAEYNLDIISQIVSIVLEETTDRYAWQTKRSMCIHTYTYASNPDLRSLN